MARSKPPRALKIRVPRQNAQRLGPSLTAEVQNVCQQDNVIVQLPPPVQEQPNSAGPSSENASEWNSLLISARAQRGPQWDVGTQQFLVEKESELYYDPTPLLEAARSLAAEAQKDSAAAQQERERDMNAGGIPLMHQNPRGSYQHQYPYANDGGGQMMNNHGHGTPVRQMSGYSGSPMSAGGAVPPGSFYGGDANTPTRPGMMNIPAATPDMYGRRITRQMSDNYYGS